MGITDLYDDFDDDLYISANGMPSRRRSQAISDSLFFEEASATGSGCSQSPENIRPSGK